MRSLLVIVLFCIQLTTNETLAQNVVLPGYEREDYFTELLALVLSYHPDKNYQLGFYGYDIPKLRAFKFIEKQKGIDVIPAGYTNERSKILKPVPLPILKGLHGWRIPLVAAENKQIFKDVAELSAFKKFNPGQMLNWSDSKIIASNGIRVVNGINYDGLFTMLVKNRFDYFPRSVIEVEGEWFKQKEMGIEIEPNIIIHYPTAYVFYVNKDNHMLANDLELGLESAYKDGKFEALFNRYFGDVVDKVTQQKRKKFELMNPFLPSNTPLQRKELWLDLAKP
ncbi:MAG: ABC transporter substrate-binding protein [Gammaproteobacteria bacterium]|nr:ABC transporter substrate-binding protein [Gammaproteobacteria bacterium]